MQGAAAEEGGAEEGAHSSSSYEGSSSSYEGDGAGGLSNGCSAADMDLVGEKEPLTTLQTDCKLDCFDIPENIALLAEHYASIRRTRADGNSFLRSFTFSFLEHILETQDTAEVDRIKTNIEEWRTTLEGAGEPGLHLEELIQPFIELLDSVIQGKETSISDVGLLRRSQCQSDSDPVVMFFRHITSGQIRRAADYYQSLVRDLEIGIEAVDQFCRSHVEPMGEESRPIHIMALSDALGVPIRIQYFPNNLDSNFVVYFPSRNSQHHPVEPFVNVLYCGPEHYEIPYYAILYPK